MSATKPPITRRRQATRDRLLAAAQRVIIERGFSGASVEEICEQAGFTRGAFYSNFDSKDDLMVDLVRTLANRRAQSVAAAPSAVADQPPATLGEALALGVDQAFTSDSSLSDDVIVVTETQLWAIRNPEYRAAHAELVLGTISTLADVLDATVERYHARYTVDRDTVARTLHALFDYARLRILLEQDDADKAKERIVEVMLQLVEAPVSPPA